MLEKQDKGLIKKVILYLITHMRALTHFEIQKLIYILDLTLVQEKQKRLCKMNYVSHNHGMFSADIADILDELEDEGKVFKEENSKRLYNKSVDGFLYESDQDIDLDEEELKEIVDDYIEEFKNKSEVAIKRFAVKFPPYNKVKKGEDIPVDEYLEEVRVYNHGLENKMDKILYDIYGEANLDNEDTIVECQDTTE